MADKNYLELQEIAMKQFKNEWRNLYLLFTVSVIRKHAMLIFKTKKGKKTFRQTPEASESRYMSR